MSIIAAFMVPHPPMIIPQIGGGRERQIEKTIHAYEKIAEEIARLKPETIIVVSPHTQIYADYFHISPGEVAEGDFAEFGAPQVKFSLRYDEEFVNYVRRKADEKDFPAGCLGERNKRLDHGTMVPLWFILQKYQDFRLVRTGYSGKDYGTHYEYGELLKEAAEALDRRVVFVASGDLSHKLQEYGPYGFAAEGPVYDEKIMDVCGNARFGELFDMDEDFCSKAAECGHHSFLVMAGALDGMAVQAEMLSHEDVTGVGYGICSFIVGEKDEGRHFLRQRLSKEEQELAEKRSHSDAYVKLARSSVEYYTQHREYMLLPTDLPVEMYQKAAAVFVSIHEHGQLRGCIGTIVPTQKCVAREIIKNAVSAAVEDPRFPPIDSHELEWLDITVDVLGEIVPVDDKNLEGELDPKKFGVIVQGQGKRGLLLPNLEGVDTIEEQIAIAKRKAGLSQSSKVTYEKFEVVRHY